MYQVYAVPYSLSLLPTQLSSLIVPHLPPISFLYPMAEVAFSVFPRSEQLSQPFRCRSPLLPTGLSCSFSSSTAAVSFQDILTDWQRSERQQSWHNTSRLHTFPVRVEALAKTVSCPQPDQRIVRDGLPITLTHRVRDHYQSIKQ